MTVLTLPGGSTANINYKRTLCCLSGRPIGVVQTSNFSCAEPNANDSNKELRSLLGSVHEKFDV